MPDIDETKAGGTSMPRKKWKDAVATFRVKARRSMTLRSYLTAMSIIILLPIMIISALSIFTIVRSSLNNSRDALVRAAQDLSLDVDREFEGLITVLQTLATDGALKAGDLQGFHHRAQAALAPRASYVLLLDDKFQQVLNTRLPFGSPLPKSAHPAIAAIVLSQKEPYITNAFIGRVSRERIVNIMMTVPVRDDVSNVLMISVNTARFQALLTRLRDSAGFSTLLIDRGARVVTSATIGDGIGLEDQSSLPVTNAAVHERVDRTGQAWLESIQRSPITGWQVVVRAPKSLIDAPMWRSLTWMLIATAIAIGSAAAFSVYLSQQMAQSIATIRHGTDDLAAGRRVTFKRPAFREAEVVMSGLTRAAALIEARSSRLRESEARYQAALRVGRMGSWETDFAAGTRSWSPEGVQLFGLVSAKGVVGGPRDEFFNALHPEDRQLMAEFHARIQTSDELDAEYRIVTPDGRVRYVAGRGEVISRQRDGSPHILINVVADVTERAKAEERAAEYTKDLAIAKTRFEALVRASAQIVWSATNSGELREDSPSWRQFTGQSQEEFLGTGWLDAVHPADRAKALDSWRTAVAAASSYSVNYRLRHIDGGYRWTSARGVPLMSGDGRVIEWVGMNEDISERMEREEHLRVVMRELSHRTKNLLAIIQSIARRTFMGHAESSEQVRLFVDRLQGLAVSHDLLVNGNWQGVSLVELISAHLRPFSTIDGAAVSIDGPPLMLRPEAAQQLGLALHELATNASKYGSLRASSGTLRVSWAFGADNDGSTLELVWTEAVPVKDKGTKRAGFGTQLLDQIVARSLGGRSTYRVDGEGVRWSIVTPLERIADRELKG